ncbi:MAG TPA: group I intron-associated PD-(D/E)XK endonuclease [Candidatus Eisenbacteria bacterium]|nr:group I intron-associated PD-(D/E)XK endonuclease [Candidatus Eisenbacteria bacterium]
MAGAKRRKPRIIKDKKKRGEWAESVFLARANEEGLSASKPWGDSRSFDCVVGRPGKFVAVQVKCTIAKLEKGEGYICSTCSSHKPYRKGSFDYLAAFVIPEDLWYIIPARLVFGLKSISLCTVGGEAKYEEYREAWSLLRKASEAAEPDSMEAQASQNPHPSNIAKDEGATAPAAENPHPSNVAKGGPPSEAARFPGNGIERMQAAFDYYKRYMERGHLGPRKPGEKE